MFIFCAQLMTTNINFFNDKLIKITYPFRGKAKWMYIRTNREKQKHIYMRIFLYSLFYKLTILFVNILNVN